MYKFLSVERLSNTLPLPFKGLTRNVKYIVIITDVVEGRLNAVLSRVACFL